MTGLWWNDQVWDTMDEIQCYGSVYMYDSNRGCYKMHLGGVFGR